MIIRLTRRRLFRLCYSFLIWLAAVWLSDTLIFLWPHRFWTWSFWMAKETILAALKLGVAFELAVLAYQAFPRARAAVARLMLSLLGCVLLLVLVRVPHQDYFPALALELQRRVGNGTALIFCSVWGLALYYRLPLHFFHRAILAGLSTYLVFFTMASALILDRGWHLRESVDVMDGLAWIAAVAYWTWIAGRSQHTSSTFIRQLQPWRERV